MASVLEIALMNAKNIQIHPFTLCMVACVNKECNFLALKAWNENAVLPYKQPRYYAVHDKCRFCVEKKIYMQAFACCYECSKTKLTLITATEAKKSFRLNDEDIAALLSFKKKHPVYKNVMTLVDEDDALHYALVKHKGPFNIRRKETNTLLKRRAKLLETFGKSEDDFKNTDFQMYMYCVHPFVKNGKGGISGVTKAIERWNAFNEQKFEELEYLERAEVENAKRMYIMRESDLVAVARDLNGIAKRRRDLTVALRGYGLQLRSDSRLCQDYVQCGEANFMHLDLDGVVAVVRQMNFLYTKTNYESRMSKAVSEIKNDIREWHGWLPREEYEDTMQYEVAEACERIKRECVQAYARKHPLPDYMQSLLPQRTTARNKQPI